MNKFKFHNVGQGLFYTGSLMRGTYNFVFDCGSSNKNMYLTNALHKHSELLPYVKGKKYVDFIVISHLHKDHFNGLYDLLQKVNIGTLYLPYLGHNEAFIKFVLAYAIFINSNDNIADDNNLFDLMVNLYLNDYRRQEYGIEKIVYYGENYSKFGCEDYKNSIILKSVDFWEFALYYRTTLSSICEELLSKRIEIELERFDSNYREHFNKTVIEFVKSSKKILKEIARDYVEVFGNEQSYKTCGELNITSAVLVHGPVNRRLCAYYSNKNSKLESDKTTTVLTGDAFVDGGFSKFWKDIININILLWQIPHHGAHENWRVLEKNAIYSRDIDMFIIPFGLGNNHKHPHVDTIDSLVEHNCEFYNVTQLDSFEYIID